jgi:uncharacterized protein (TIGR03085 family)
VRTPILGQAADLHEFFVHQEDIRRANGLPRRTDPVLDEALWRIVPVVARWLLRRARGLSITLVLPDGRPRQFRRRGSFPVEVRGPVQELFLWLYGRQPVDVHVEGSDDAVRLLAGASIGM